MHGSQAALAAPHSRFVPRAETKDDALFKDSLCVQKNTYCYYNVVVIINDKVRAERSLNLRR